MKKLFLILCLLLACMTLPAQTMQDSNYRTIGYVKSDGTVQDSNYRTIGHVKNDGTIQDSNYHTIGHASGVNGSYAAVLFFFYFLR